MEERTEKMLACYDMRAISVRKTMTAGEVVEGLMNNRRLPDVAPRIGQGSAIDLYHLLQSYVRHKTPIPAVSGYRLTEVRIEERDREQGEVYGTFVPVEHPAMEVEATVGGKRYKGILYFVEEAAV